MSRLTDIRAPVAGGASARPVRDQGAGIAEAQLARVGDQIANVGERLERDRLGRQLARAQVDMAGRLNDLRSRYDAPDMRDPDEIDLGFKEDADKLRAEMLKPLEGRNVEAAGLAFDELRDRHAVQLGRRALALRRDEDLGAVAGYVRTARLSGGQPDPDFIATQVGQFAELLGGMVERGSLTPDQMVAELTAFEAERWRALAELQLSEDPRALAESADALTGLPVDDREAYRRRAAAEVKRRDRAAAAEVERADNERQRELKRQLDELTSLALAGRQSGFEALIGNDEAKDHPEYAAAAAAVRLRDVVLPEFAILPPAEQAALIAEEKDRSVPKYEAPILDAMERAHAASSIGWERDPVAKARELGGTVPPLPEDLTDTAALTAAFAARDAFGASLADQGYVARPIYFDADELDLLRQAVSPDADPGQRARMAAAVTAGFGGSAVQVFDMLEASPVMAHVGAMHAAGVAGERVAVELLRGEQALDAEGAAYFSPSRQARGDYVQTILGDALTDQPAAFATVLRAADGLYALRAGRLAPEDHGQSDQSQVIYAQALQDALGRRVMPDGRVVGGAGVVRGRPTLLPTDMSGEEFEGLMDAAEDGFGAAFPRIFKVVERFETIWKAASVGGGAPVMGREAMTPDDMRHVFVRAMPGGRYRMGFQTVTGQDVYAYDGETGAPFEFTPGALRDALSEAAR